MAAKHKPATPLPWYDEESSNTVRANGERVSGTKYFYDAAYIAHAANAYPKLVEALRDLLTAGEHPSLGTKSGRLHAQDMATKAANVLRELGEE